MEKSTNVCNFFLIFSSQHPISPVPRLTDTLSLSSTSPQRNAMRFTCVLLLFGARCGYYFSSVFVQQSERYYLILSSIKMMMCLAVMSCAASLSICHTCCGLSLSFGWSCAFRKKKNRLRAGGTPAACFVDIDECQSSCVNLKMCCGLTCSGPWKQILHTGVLKPLSV